MSTERSRLVSSIRRIALTDPDLSSALDAWQNRGDQSSSTGTGTSDAERDRLCCDGSTSDNSNPGADTRDTSEGGQSSLNEDDPALLDSGQGSLTGVTDCATGEPICFDGSDWLPPVGWDGPTDPPVDPEYQDGIFLLTFDDAKFALPEDAAQHTFEESEFAGDPTGCVLDSYTDNGDGTWTVLIICDGGEQFTPEFQEVNCAPEDGGTAYCDPDPDDITEDSWPEDGCTNLAIKSGTIVGSKYDPENDGSYSKPMSEIELCDGSGNSFFLSPAANGGWKTIDSTKTDGYLYDSQGNKIAHIDGNEYSDPSI